MPRQGVDTLYVSFDTCYTILDPGGMSNYEHNEDSWLLIVCREGTGGFYLQGDYDLGSEYSGADYLHVYYDTAATSGYTPYTGKGRLEVHRNRTLLYLHTNNYAAYEGLRLHIRFDNTISTPIETPLNDSTVHLAWDDYNPNAGEWRVSYWNNIGDTLVETTRTTSVTLTGLAHNTHYLYKIGNDASPCMKEETRRIKMPCDNGTILLPLRWDESDTLEYGQCYHIYDAAGPGEERLSTEWAYLTLRTREGNGLYLRSLDTLEVDYLRFEEKRPNSSQSVYLNEGRHNSFYHYFPKGEVQIHSERIQKCGFEVLQENDRLVHPTVVSTTETSATLAWTDYSASSAWTLRYGCSEGAEETLHLTTPEATLHGLLPGKQYVYSIEGNDTAYACMVPARHGFITSMAEDTLIMPYRGVDTLNIDPTKCYTLLDPGGTGNYFHTDWSTLVVRTEDGRGFRLTGYYNLNEGDQLTLIDGENESNRRTCSYQSNLFEYACTSGTLTMIFVSDIRTNREGFAFQIHPYSTTVYDVRDSNVTDSSAILAWSDTSAGENRWIVRYGADEESMQTVTTTTPEVTLTGLLPGTQYVYSVRNERDESTCLVTLRQAFITEGVAAGTVIMPYRGTDTLSVPDTCLTIYDGGGIGHDYFDNDTSYLVLISPTGDDFYVTVEFVYEGQDEHDFRHRGYDSDDRLDFFTDPHGNYAHYQYYGYHNRYNYEELPRVQSSNGYLKIRFTSNSRKHRRGFKLTVDRDSASVSEVTFHRVKATEAQVRWNDNGENTSWRVWYSSQNDTLQYVDVTTKQVNLYGLVPASDYEVRITDTTATWPCGARVWSFSTLDANSIVMNYRSIDTVILQPYECYTVYDPGGNSDYFGNDSSLLLIKTANGEPFRLYGYCNVGNRDNADKIRITSDTARHYWWSGSYNVWDEDIFCHQGVALISLVTNEAFHESGFVLKVQYAPSIYHVDTTHLSDSAVTITWQDTSSATAWTVTYGPSEDSMTTIVETDTTVAMLTGLRRNQQFYYRIENNVSYQQCMMPSVYGVIMPHDEDIIIMPYRNYDLERAGRSDLYNTDRVTVAPGHCYMVYDDGAENSMFSGQEGWKYIFSTDGRGMTIEGDYHYYDDASLYLSGARNSSWYDGHGYLSFYSNDGSIGIYHRTTRNGDICYNPGYKFQIFMNYPIFNIRTDSLSCTSATLLWEDTSSATQWTIAYGAAESQLDTVVVDQRRLELENLEPDHQYVCYFYSNDTTSGDCVRPVKYAFITTCDTSLIILPYNSNGETRIIDINGCYTVMAPGATNDYFYQDNVDYYLQSNTRDNFILRGTYKLGENDHLYIYDGRGTHLFSTGGNTEGELEVQSLSGRMHIDFVSGADTSVAAGFTFDIRFQAIANVRTDLMTDSTCRVRWDDHSTGTEWTFWYGKDKDNLDSIHTIEKRVHLQDLEPEEVYYVFITNNATECIDTTWFEFCSGSDECINYADLYSCHTTARYGRFNNPGQSLGVIDEGWDNIYSRHTVVDDTLARDPRTNNLLRCVPSGYSESVRLGNWDIGGQAEQLHYDYIVDTTLADLLLLNYAAVLEQPGHNDYDQPHFRFAILNDQGHEINPECYSADFVASDSLGWNRNDSILWKDWTSVGVDLTPLHGQHIIVQLTTYDCNQMGHYGYAYFTMGCDRKRLETEMCGNISSNSFTAPEGFRYEWYNVDSSDVVLSRERTFVTTKKGTYRCRALFVGNRNAEHCYFEKTAVVGNTMPMANFDYEVIDTVGCEVTVKFYNRSKVLLVDSNSVEETAQECESFVWYFGDGEVSYDEHPTHIFPAGHFDVRLVAGVSDASCEDDTTMTIAMPSPCISYDTIVASLCHGDTLWVRDSAFAETGDYFMRHEYREDSIWESFVYLIVNPVYDTVIHGGICDGEPYNGWGFHVTEAGTYHGDYRTVAGCDSLLTLHAELVYPADTLLVERICGNYTYTFGDTVLNVSGEYVDSLHTWYGCDSVVSLDLTVYPYTDTVMEVAICRGDVYRFGENIYTETGVHTDSLATVQGCDSILTLQLTVNAVYYDTVHQEFCQHTTTEYNRDVYSLPGVYPYRYRTIAGCDSVWTLVLTYYDSLFAADMQWSLDEEQWWPSDSIVIGCTPMSLYLRDASTGNAEAQWYFEEDGTTVEGRETEHEYEQAGVYSIRLMAKSAEGCLDTMVRDSVIVYESPQAYYIYEPSHPSRLQPEVVFANRSTPRGEIAGYLWKFYNDRNDAERYDSTEVENPTYTWPAIEEVLRWNYVASLEARRHYRTPKGDTTTCANLFRDTIVMLNEELWFPNAVSPNGDGVNDLWVVVNLAGNDYYTGSHIWIYDRWGKKIFERENPKRESDFWDPNATGSPDGTYYYRCVATGLYGRVERNGVIEVLR